MKMFISYGLYSWALEIPAQVERTRVIADALRTASACLSQCESFSCESYLGKRPGSLLPLTWSVSLHRQAEYSPQLLLTIPMEWEQLWYQILGLRSWLWGCFNMNPSFLIWKRKRYGPSVAWRTSVRIRNDATSAQHDSRHTPPPVDG